MSSRALTRLGVQRQSQPSSLGVKMKYYGFDREEIEKYGDDVSRSWLAYEDYLIDSVRDSNSSEDTECVFSGRTFVELTESDSEIPF